MPWWTSAEASSHITHRQKLSNQSYRLGRSESFNRADLGEIGGGPCVSMLQLGVKEQV